MARPKVRVKDFAVVETVAHDGTKVSCQAWDDGKIVVFGSNGWGPFYLSPQYVSLQKLVREKATERLAQGLTIRKGFAPLAI